MIPKKIKANPPHKGAVTHHHDQFIKPVSFSVIKIKNIKPRGPTPLDELELLFFIFKIIFCGHLFGVLSTNIQKYFENKKLIGLFTSSRRRPHQNRRPRHPLHNRPPLLCCVHIPTLRLVIRRPSLH